MFTGGLIFLFPQITFPQSAAKSGYAKAVKAFVDFHFGDAHAWEILHFFPIVQAIFFVEAFVGANKNVVAGIFAISDGVNRVISQDSIWVGICPGAATIFTKPDAVL